MVITDWNNRKGEMSNRKVRVLGILVYLYAVLLTGNVSAQEVENQVQFRSDAAFSKKITPKLKIELEPELRWLYSEGFDRFLLNGQLEYKLIKYLEVFAGYRLVWDRNDEEEINKYDKYHRYQFGATGKIELFDFKPSLRLMYTDYSDDTESDNGNNFIRYKMSLEYNIPKCKLTPEIAFEGFYKLDESNIYKYRYKAGLDYKISKTLSVSTGYSLDYYMTDYKNRHIIDIGLKLRL